MELTLNDIKQTSVFRAAEQEALAAKAQAEQDRQSEAIEAARLRAERGRYLKEQFEDAVSKYEVQRNELHQSLRHVWEAAQQYSACTGQLPNTLSENVFNSIDIPSLRNPNNFSSGFSTTRAAVMGWFATGAKSW
jgi:hypothetical protein